MNKNNIIVFLVLCAFVAAFYLFMHYQVKSAENIIDTIPSEAKSTMIDTAVQAVQPSKMVRPQQDFFEVDEVDDGFDIDPGDVETLIGD
jgi:LPS O-antigen subunit length determinant protein (WzzB/FepE family)